MNDLSGNLRREESGGRCRVRRASDTVALNIKQVIEMWRFVRLKCFVSDGEKFVLDALFNFKPMERFKTGEMRLNLRVSETV